MSAGFEDSDAKGVFQFNLAHRVSVYSIPKGHRGPPNTAIILFYPQLTMCNNPHHYEPYENAERRRRDRHIPTANRDLCSLVKFRGIPDTVPPMSKVTYTHGRDLTPDEVSKYGNEKYPLSEKGDYASFFDKEFMIHTDQRWQRLQQSLDCDFIHIFSFLLFKIMAAN
jgi:hypothetical protein